MQPINWLLLAATAALTTAAPSEEKITINHFPACEQTCMRESSWIYPIENHTFETLCVGEQRKWNFNVWVLDFLEPCLLETCGWERDSVGIIGLWDWYDKTCGPNPGGPWR